MKGKIALAVFVVFVFAVIILGVYWDHHTTLVSYEEAIHFIEEGEYEKAMAQLEKANKENLGGDELRAEFQYGGKHFADYYMDTGALYLYALARNKYPTDDSVFYVHQYLELIPESYNGTLHQEIKDFKKAFTPEYEAYLAEQERKAEEARIDRQKREQEYIAGLKNKIPYIGMSEVYINSTAAGKAGKHDSKYVKGRGADPGYNYDKYYWYATHSNDIVLIVECEDGKVTDVTKYFEWVYWTSDGMPKFWATKPKTTTKSNNTQKKDDPYDVYEYSDPEDFYYDNYDDFWEYEEAEDYFNEHHDD